MIHFRQINQQATLVPGKTGSEGGQGRCFRKAVFLTFGAGEGEQVGGGEGRWGCREVSVRYTTGCIAALLASTHEMPLASLSPRDVTTSQDIAKPP